MMRLRRAAAWLLGLSVLLSGLSGLRAETDPYTVSGIPVDVTAASAVEARARALEQAQREGLRQLFARLVAAEDLPRLPPVEEIALDTLVRGYGIDEEKRSATRYVGRVTVHYRPDGVRALFEERGVAAVLEPAAPLVVVPLIDDGEGAPRIAISGHPWQQAWLEELERNTFLRLLLPLGDLGDLSRIRRYLMAAVEPDPQPLLELAARYDAAGVALARAAPTGVDLPGEPLGLRVALRTAGEWPALDESFELARQDGESTDELWRRAVVESKVRLQEAWKRENLVRTDLLDRVRVRVPLADLASWVQIRRELDRIPEVRAVRLERLSRQEAELELEFAGGSDRLIRRLEERGLTPVAERDLWRLRPAAADAVP